MATPRVPVAKRFAAKCGTPDANGCIPWMATHYPNGYGQIRLDGRGPQVGAHRIAWQLRHGAIPDGLFVCHHCDNRGCVNVDHLFLGTHSENMLDMYAKGRLNLAGENHNTAKLSNDDVRWIRMWK